MKSIYALISEHFMEKTMSPNVYNLKGELINE